MFRKLLLGTSAVFAVWTAFDFIVHGLLLEEYYKETAHLWRPKGEGLNELDTFVVLVSSLMFVLIYALLVNPKELRVGLLYGVFFGTATGAVAGYGAYAFMPVPQMMAFVWTLNGLVQGIGGGLAVGFLIREDSSP